MVISVTESVVYAVMVIFACLISFFMGRRSYKRTNGKVDAILGIDKRGEEKDYYDMILLTPTTELEKKAYLNVEVKVKE